MVVPPVVASPFPFLLRSVHWRRPRAPPLEMERVAASQPGRGRVPITADHRVRAGGARPCLQLLPGPPLPQQPASAPGECYSTHQEAAYGC